MQKEYFVYIVSSISKTIYIGVTNNLSRRIHEHKNGLLEGFTKKYRVNSLVYYESYFDIRDAIAREKELKSWRRNKKYTLIEDANPGWQELSL